MEFKHFSHSHNLRLYQVHQDDELLCHGCNSFCLSESVYGCWNCKFFLHRRCADANRSMLHSSHPNHHLTLVPYTTYSTGSFLCNACGDTGNAFTFCCPICEFDLHVQCATLPQFAKHEAHMHNLSLAYGLLDPVGMSHLCNICNKILDQKFWSYNCFGCNFRAHTYCAMKERRLQDDQIGNVHPQTGPHGTGQEQTGEDRTEVDPALSAQVELQRLQLEMEMANSLAQMMSSFNLSSLV